MTQPEIHLLSACKLRELFCKGELSATGIVEHFLKRIDTLDKEIGSFLAVFHERARKQAEALDAKRERKEPLGKLAGVPIAIKDNIHVKGEYTTCASKFLTNYQALFDATAIRHLLEEDAIIIGKTNMDEFAMGSSTENSALQKTKNPWDLNSVPGGSSGGSAAAVAARLVPIALGSDTGGSVRQPASFCGIVGFKPTYGRVSRYGLVAYGSSLDQIGPMSVYTEDTALVMEVIGKHCDKDSTSIQQKAEDYFQDLSLGLQGIKIGVPLECTDHMESGAKQNFFESIERLKKLGATIVDIRLSKLKYSIPVYYVLATAEASTNLARFDGVRYGLRSSRAETLDQVYDYSKEEGFGKEVKRRILLGTYVLSSGYKDAYYKKAQKVRSLIIKEYVEQFKTCQLIAMPVSPYAAFASGSIKDPLQMYLADIYTIAPNLAGLPAISVPSGLSSDKKPLGLQLIGPQLQDVKVCRAAFAFEKSISFIEQLPPMIQSS